MYHIGQILIKKNKFEFPGDSKRFIKLYKVIDEQSVRYMYSSTGLKGSWEKPYGEDSISIEHVRDMYEPQWMYDLPEAGRINSQKIG